ncbi:polyprenyl synthetase family protein [Streptomyces triculaminicus]|uniref:polyprenyl synthetase family protein n=1 Tax=Streptomyces triculaminicus TaxID=2816232 RepID=UPI00340E026A
MNKHFAQDPPHPDRAVERWCVNARVRMAEGGEHGLSVLFLCHRQDPGDTPARPSAHTLIWSHTDHTTNGHTFESWMDDAAFARARSAIQDGGGAWDPHVRRAVLDALADGRPLLPDRLLPAPVRVDAHRLDLDFGGVATLRRNPDGSYALTVTGQEEGFALTVRPRRAPLPLSAGEGPDGLVVSCLPRMTVDGTLTAPGRAPAPVTGEAWLERSFAGVPGRAPGPNGAPSARMWAQVRLDNGWDATVLRTSLVEETADAPPPDAAGPDRPMTTHTTTEQHTVCALAGPDRPARRVTADLRTVRHWDSSLTLNSYPVGTRLRIPEAGLDVRLTAAPRDQEVLSMSVGRAFWQGECEVEGTMAGRPVRGHARVEFVPPHAIGDLEDFMRRVGRLTRAEVRRYYPDAADGAALRGLSGLEGHTPLDDSSAAEVHAQLVLPVRHLTDLGGKTWRSFASACVMALFCRQADRYRPLMAVTELLHAGSLIVDDVEDDSPLRRGGPTVHEAFGVPTAINAGTAAYFVFDRVADDVLPEDPVLRLRVYRAFLRALRAGHAGQALDIAGHGPAMDAAVATGDASALLERLHSTHRLKSGLPVRMFAEASALLTGAGEEQIAAIGAYFEAVGVAYQISDDVADLRGIGTVRHQGRRRAAKRVAEDLLNGKVTVPLAHAVPLLSPERRRSVWAAVRGGRATPAVAAAVAAVLTECGAVDAARAHAVRLLDEAWPAVDAALPPTMPKALLRGLGRYAAQREDDVPDVVAPAQPPAPRKPLRLTGDRV